MKFSACQQRSEPDRMPVEIVRQGHDSPGCSLTFKALSGGDATHVSAPSTVQTPKAQGDITPPAQKLPDPWLFDSESLIREIDRIRETALQVPCNGDSNATHFGLQQVINAAWTLRENMRYVLGLHRQGQDSFRNAGSQHQTIYGLLTWLRITC